MVLKPQLREAKHAAKAQDACPICLLPVESRLGADSCTEPSFVLIHQLADGEFWAKGGHTVRKAGNPVPGTIMKS